MPPSPEPPPAAPRRTITTADLALSAIVLGPPEGAPLLAIHGSMDHGGTFLPLADALLAADPGLRLALLDRRGFGRSERLTAGRYAFLDHVADALDAVDALRADGARHDVVLAGHSLGSLIALAAAAALEPRTPPVTPPTTPPESPPESPPKPDARPAPETGTSPRCRALILLDTFPPKPPEDPVADLLAAARDRRRRPPAALIRADRAEALARLRARHARVPEAALRRWAAEGLIERDDGRVEHALDPRHRLRDPIVLRPDLVTAMAARVTAPVLALRGADSVVREAPAWLDAFPSVRRVDIPDAGHMLHLEQAEAVSDAIRSFLAEIG